jgi:uncharacterized damage-inducible protein DinB
MTKRPPKVHEQFGRSAAQIFTANERMNQMLIEQLDPAVWQAKPTTAKPRDRGRSIAAIFSHVHNVRCKWVRLSAPHLKVPSQLNRALCTPRQASAALAESAARCAEMLAEAFSGDGSKIQKFRRDGWAKPWPVGPEMLCYMLAHEAHHRGQVCMLTHQLGFPLAAKFTSELWNWERLWRERGWAEGPGST